MINIIVIKKCKAEKGRYLSDGLSPHTPRLFLSSRERLIKRRPIPSPTHAHTQKERRERAREKERGKTGRWPVNRCRPLSLRDWMLIRAVYISPTTDRSTERIIHRAYSRRQKGVSFNFVKYEIVSSALGYIPIAGNAARAVLLFLF